MKDMINERILLLSTAQESMMDVADMMDQWDSSQLNTEKNAFDSMNASDKVLNMSKEGNRLVVRLQECCKEMSSDSSVEKCLKTSEVLEEIKNLFQSITEQAAEVNDISHRIEGEVAHQKEIEEGIRQHLVQVSESLDAAVACAELMMAGMY